MTEKIKFLSSGTLKVIALASMLTDHIGHVLFPEITILRIIGRMAMVIYCFLLAEGFFHTRNVWFYMARLFAFALISEIPFDLAVWGKVLEFNHQNVFFTLALGVLAMKLASYTTDFVSEILIIGGVGIGAELLKTDYAFTGILMIYIFYKYRDYRPLACFGIAFINMVMAGGLQAYGTLAVIPILLYSGEKGNKIFDSKLVKYGFYAMYPLHLLALYGIKLLT